VPGRLRLLLAAAAVAIAGVGTGTVALGLPARPAAAYYVALGDSLSQGFQPMARRGGAGVDTDAGYPDVVQAALSRAAPAAARPTLVKLGCPGETTTTMIRGGICRYAGADGQLGAAADFLAAHRGRIDLVTLDIGINDVVRCEGRDPSPRSAACASAGLAALARDLPVILATVHRLAGSAAVIGLNYYDPYAVDAALGGDGPGRAAWAAQVTSRLNAALAATYARFGVPVADVADSFSPEDPTTLCRLTWMCSGPPVGQNLHADAAGYRVMASAVEAVEPVALARPVGSVRRLPALGQLAGGAHPPAVGQHDQVGQRLPESGPLHEPGDLVPRP